MLTPEQEKNVAEWVKALRSGEFKQGRGFLEVDGENCCLGVACRLYQRKVGGLEEGKEGSKTVFDGHTGFLPWRVKEWLGLSVHSGLSTNADVSLTELNDNGRPFSEIADLIESRPPGLFV